MSIAVIALVSASSIIYAQGFKNISEILTGYEEVPAVSTLDASVNVLTISNADDGYNQSLILDFVDDPKVAFANPV
ncbi:MAG TPA: hypothetical protein VM941_11910 [Pyrinomonadaceae bacterium]|nr:hypothetical protein [Pyrinomonadaceae bacterium]